VSEIANEVNDYTLNIRRYVDNTPPAEPHDVTAHLKGGVPNVEIADNTTRFGAKFKFKPDEIFIPRDNSEYSDFRIKNKSEIKSIIESSMIVMASYGAIQYALFNWWEQGREIFSTLAKNHKANLPSIRRQLLSLIHQFLSPLNLLDRFQISGIFVRWWDSIKYDLKTIRPHGWDIDLINNEDFRHLIVDKYFKKQQLAIDELKTTLASQESALASLVEEALELCEYEPEEDEKLTPKLAKQQIATNVANLSKEDAEPYENALDNIVGKESLIKQIKAKCVAAELELMLHVEIKCYGTGDKLAELKSQREVCVADLNAADADLTVAISPIAEHLADITSFETIKNSIKALKSALKKDDKKQPSAKNKELLATIDKVEKSLKLFDKRFKPLREALDGINERIAYINQLYSDIGGSVTEGECREMILQKHFLIVESEMRQYVDSERRRLVAAFENLWDKYAVSAEQIKRSRDASLDSLMSALSQLHYLN